MCSSTEPLNQCVTVFLLQRKIGEKNQKAVTKATEHKNRTKWNYSRLYISTGRFHFIKRNSRVSMQQKNNTWHQNLFKARKKKIYRTQNNSNKNDMKKKSFYSKNKKNCCCFQSFCGLSRKTHTILLHKINFKLFSKTVLSHSGCCC